MLDPAHTKTGKGGKEWGVMDMRRALKDRLVGYKIPQVMRVLGGEGGIPRNAMGKGELGLLCFLCWLWGCGGLTRWVLDIVNKKTLVKEIFGDEHSGSEH